MRQSELNFKSVLIDLCVWLDVNIIAARVQMDLHNLNYTATKFLNVYICCMYF